MVRDWAMLGTCSVSQLPPITPSSFSELCETERLEEDIISSLLVRPSVRPSLEVCISELFDPELEPPFLAWNIARFFLAMCSSWPGAGPASGLLAPSLPWPSVPSPAACSTDRDILAFSLRWRNFFLA
jgi:hypothetical protein